MINLETLIWLAVLIGYSYVVAMAVSAAYFKQKLRYHRAVLSDLTTGEKVNGSKAA